MVSPLLLINRKMQRRLIFWDVAIQRSRSWIAANCICGINCLAIPLAEQTTLTRCGDPLKQLSRNITALWYCQEVGNDNEFIFNCWKSFESSFIHQEFGSDPSGYLRKGTPELIRANEVLSEEGYSLLRRIEKRLLQNMRNESVVAVQRQKSASWIPGLRAVKFSA